MKEIDKKNNRKPGEKRRRNPLAFVVFLMIAIGIALGIFFSALFQQFERGILEVCAEQQDGYVQLVLDQINLNADRSDDEMIQNIIGTLDASSNQYWVFSKEEDILFVKDVSETNQYKSLKADSYYDTGSSRAFLKALKRDQVVHREITLNHKDYLASGTIFRYQDHSYRLVLLTNQSVIFSNNTYLGAKTAFGAILGLTLILLVLLPILLVHRYERLRRKSDEQEDEILRLRKAVSDLNEDLALRPIFSLHKGEDTAMDKSGYRNYELKFYLNAEHYVIFDNKKGDVHPHTWEFTLEFGLPRDTFHEFGEIEKSIQEYLKKYQNTVLNDHAPFDSILPTVENMTDYFTGEFQKRIEGFDGVLYRVSAGETPTRHYYVEL